MKVSHSDINLVKLEYGYYYFSKEKDHILTTKSRDIHSATNFYKFKIVFEDSEHIVGIGESRLMTGFNPHTYAHLEMHIYCKIPSIWGINSSYLIEFPVDEKPSDEELKEICFMVGKKYDLFNSNSYLFNTPEYLDLYNICDAIKKWMKE